MAQETLASFDSQFEDLSLDDIPDLPEYGAWPAGTYVATVKLARKVVKMSGEDTPCVEASFKLVAVQATEAEKTPVEGSESSILYNLHNEFGLGNFKKIAKVAQDYFGCAGSVGAVVDAVQDIPCIVTLSAKEDKTKTLRNNVVELILG